MRQIIAFAAASVGLLALSTGRTPAADLRPACLSSGDASDAVVGRSVVAPSVAIAHARREAPNADVLRAALCREPDALVYRITLLRRDGRLVRVTLEAASGKVRSVH